MKINYEMVYEIRKAQVPTDSLSNLCISYSNDVMRRADAEREKYFTLLKKLLGHSAFVMPATACVADGVRGRAYVGGCGAGVGQALLLFLWGQ